MKKAFAAALLFFAASGISAEKGVTLSMRDFIDRSAKNDPAFQVILIDSLYERYQRDIQLPASDIVLDIAGQYNLIIQDKKPSVDGSISLSKLFPMSGTTLSAEYGASRSFIKGEYNVTSAFSVQVSQDIARNAFGRGTRLQDKKIGIEMDLARFQVVEAYEDYLASLMTLYMDWYLSWENLRAGEDVYRYNQDLYEMIRKKMAYRVAMPEDVEKIRLEVITAKEDLIVLRDRYDQYTLQIRETADISEGLVVPAAPETVAEEIGGRSMSVSATLEKSRTGMMLQLLEKKGILSMDIAKDNMLPSLNLFLGYNIRSNDYDMKDSDHSVYTGITSSIGIIRSKERAEYKTAEIDLKKTRLSNKSSLLTLKISLHNLKSQIQREGELSRLAKEKIKAAESVLAAERRNYAIGRTSLNDLIVIKNNMTQIRYNVIYHDVLYKQLMVEWRRMTDTLVSKSLEKSD